MTANDVYETALVLMDSAEDIGDTTSDYYTNAPYLINILQRELARLENVDITAKIESLDDELEISDDTAERVMPYGLAAKFALADKDQDTYNDYSIQYSALCKTIALDEEDVVDEYSYLTGMQL